MFRTILPLVLTAVGITASTLPNVARDEAASGDNANSTTLHARLSQINATHCEVNLSNEGNDAYNFLKWNSLFDSKTESHSFSLQNAKTRENLTHGPDMLRKIYTKVHPEHIITLAAHSSWNESFDLTQLFEIPEEGEYVVSLTSTLTALSNTTQLSNNFPVNVESEAVTMMLTKSSSTLKPRIDLSDNALIHTCDAAQTWVIQQTVQQATGLAMNAKKAVPVFNPIVGYFPNETLYQEYFNDDSQQSVFNAFNLISGYSLTANPGIGLTFYCNTDAGHSNECSDTPGVVGYAPSVGAYNYVTLCDYFFSNIWSSTLCGLPGTETPPAGTSTSNWQQPFMQAGVVLHEMLHCYLVVKTSTIVDGPDPNNQGGNNYLYSGVASLAQNAATNNDAPLTNSQNFVYFAQAVGNTVASAPCNCCSYGGPTLSECNGLTSSAACVTCTCGGVNPNPDGA